MEKWKTNLYTIWFSQILSLTSFGFGMPFLPYYIQELGITSPDQINIYTAIIGAMPAISMGIMAPIWGIVSDKWGRKLMLLRALFAAIFVIGGMGFVTSVNQLIFLRFLQGAFTGTITAAAALVSVKTPDTKISYALGFLSSATFIGFSLGPVIGGFVAESFGYRTSFIIGGFLMLIDFLVVLIFVENDRLPTIRKLRVATVKSSENRENNEICSDLKNENASVKSSIVKSSSDSAKNNTSLLSIINTSTVLLLVILLFHRISTTIFPPYLPLFVQQIRDTLIGSAKITGIISAVVGIASALSGITISRLGDKYNRYKLAAILIGVGITIAFPIVLIKDIWIFAIFYAFLFFVMAGIEPIITSMNLESVSTNSRGRLFGIQGFVSSLGWGLSSAIASIVSIRASLNLIFVVIIFMLTLSLVALWLHKRKFEVV